MARKPQESVFDLEGLSDKALVDRWRKKTTREREGLAMNEPDVFEIYVAAGRRVEQAWEYLFSDKAFRIVKGRPRKVLLKIQHPTLDDVYVGTHRMTLDMLNEHLAKLTDRKRVVEKAQEGLAMVGDMLKEKIRIP